MRSHSQGVGCMPSYGSMMMNQSEWGESELRGRKCCSNVGVYLEVRPEGGEVLGLLLEQGGDVAVFEIVL